MASTTTHDDVTHDDVTLVEHEQLPAVTSSLSHTERVDYITDETITSGRTVDDVVKPKPTSQNGEAYVLYSGTGGGSAVVKQPTLVTNSDGHVQIVTPRHENVTSEERPLREKDIKCLLYFSLVAVVLMPPLGVAALIYSFLTRREFNEGLEKGDLSKARRMSKRCEKLIIFSLISGLVMYVIVFAIIEKNARADGTDIGLGHLHLRPPG